MVFVTCVCRSSLQPGCALRLSLNVSHHETETDVHLTANATTPEAESTRFYHVLATEQEADSVPGPDLCPVAGRSCLPVLLTQFILGSCLGPFQ